MGQDTKAARETGALQEFYAMLAADPARAFYGPGHVRAAAELGAVGTLLLSDSLLRVNNIQQARPNPYSLIPDAGAGRRRHAGAVGLAAVRQRRPTGAPPAPWLHGLHAVSAVHCSGRLPSDEAATVSKRPPPWQHCLASQSTSADVEAWARRGRIVWLRAGVCKGLFSN